ncbi:MAG: TVP38/TMEM64 family protein [Gemmatimonadetes bacterium]|nr:TVP38/TMEM64 family protein [Gemmatimonadota bacterium]
MKSNAARIALALAAAAGLFALFRWLPVNDWIQRLLTAAAEMGPAGPVLLAGAYIVACVLLIPGSLITLGAGFVFGLVTGGIAVSIGATLGAAAAFLIGRKLARGRVEARVRSNSRFQAIDEAVGREGFKIVLLTRLSPVFPFNLLNYAYGVTKVSFRDYFFASWIGMLPGTLMYVYLGSAAKNISDLFAGNVEGGAGQQVLFAAGLLATVIVTVFVTRISKRALNEAIRRDEREQAAGAPSRAGS